MFIVNSYSLAVVFCFITMMCWARGEIHRNWHPRVGDMNSSTGIT